jgi:hypothetical protein
MLSGTVRAFDFGSPPPPTNPPPMPTEPPGVPSDGEVPPLPPVDQPPPIDDVPGTHETPEPATLGLALLGAGLLYVRRRK